MYKRSVCRQRKQPVYTLCGTVSTIMKDSSPENGDCSIKFVVHRRFDALEAEWNALLARTRFNSFFLTYEWQTTWWEYLGHGELLIVACHDAATDELIGILPLYQFSSQASAPEDRAAAEQTSADEQICLTLVGCIEVSDYLDVIIVAGWEAAVYKAFGKWLVSEAAPQWDRLDLCNLPEASQSYTLGAAIFEEQGYAVRVVQEDVAPQFELPFHYEEYLAQQVDKKQRHEIRRKQRRAVRETVVDFSIIGLDRIGDQKRDFDADLDTFIRLQRASRDDKAEFMTATMERFFRGVAKRMLEAGYLRLCFLSLNGETAATLFAYEYNNSFLLYNSGYDPDAYRQHSPGWVLTAYTIQYAVAAGLRLYDFMQGDEEYKYRFGATDYKVLRVLVENRVE